jgi:hypothetical protein
MSNMAIEARRRRHLPTTDHRDLPEGRARRNTRVYADADQTKRKIDLAR